MTPSSRVLDIPYIVRKMLILFLFLLPFQKLPTVFVGTEESKKNIVLRLINNTDEIVFLLTFILASSFILLRPSRYSFKLKDFSLSIFLIIFAAIGILSIIINRVYPLQGFLGIYDLLKNILVIYAFASLHWSKKEFLTVINGIKIITVIFAVFGIAAEIAALYGEIGVGQLTAEVYKQRLGLYRVGSLAGVGQINYLAIYSTLAFFFILATETGFLKTTKSFFSFTMILLTFSRQGWAGFITMLILFKRSKFYILLALTLIVLAIIMTMLKDESFDPDKYYRGFAYIESLKLWKENPFLGVGPGMFGGLVSVLFDSPFYDTWPSFFRDFIYRIGGIDSFWPIIWTETGLIGLLAFWLIWLSIFRGLNKISFWFKETNDRQMYEIGRILKYFLIAIFIMCFATGLNAAFIVFTYFALIGMYISIYAESKDRENPPIF